MNSKDKRIKKLKSKRAWPSIFGLFFIVLLFGILLLAMVGINLQNVIQGKVLTSMRQAEPVTKLFEKYEEDEQLCIQESVINYVTMVPDVEAVWISDKEGNPVWATSEKSPVLENTTEIYLGEKEYVCLVIDEDPNNIFSNEGIKINKEFFSKGNILKVLKSDINGSEEIINLKVWYLQEVNNLNIYVLQDVTIYTYDCYIFIMSIFLFGVMIVVFIFYYIGSFVSVLIDIRRTTKVLYTDIATGGNNWLYFEKKGNKLLKRKFSSNNYAVIHLKMRKYRSFCTCFGVKEGDILIEKLYQVIKRHIRRNELMAYKENAKFGLLLTYTDQQQLCQRINQLTNDLNNILVNMNLYFAVGIYVVNSGEIDIDQLYNNATLACDALGEEAETKIVFYDEEMNNRRLWERKVEDDMYAALANHEFKVYLQPKISASKETLAGAEALVRWIHPREGFIPPNKFIPIFERNGFILKLDDYMLDEIARQQAIWISQGRKVVPISVNVSRAHFAKEDLAEHICGIVDKYQVPHNVIELELTESAFFDDKQLLLETVRKLREAGFIVSMDDFGAGYSSLNSLKELKLDVIKIDADFFRGVEAEERGLLIVSEVIDLAKKLDMKIVAEGIESREQVDFLIEQECDLIQGYFFAKPMPIIEFEQKYSV